MTTKEQSLADDKMRAEIIKMQAKTNQINVNTFLAPTATAAALIGATAIVVKILC